MVSGQWWVVRGENEARLRLSYQTRRMGIESAMSTPDKTRPILHLLMVLYIPALIFTCVLALMAGIGLIVAGREHLRVVGFLFFTLPAIALFLMIVHVVVSLRVLFDKQRQNDDLEICVKPQWIHGLTLMVNEVADEHGLPRPDEIRLHAESAAHVYEDEEGRRILVIGGLLLAGLTERALSGVVAHELGHFAAGDTELSRTASKWLRLFGQIEWQFAAIRFSMFNPFVWLLRGYHRLFALAFFANSRAQEFVADEWEIEHVGPKQSARTSILLSAMEHLPNTQLAAVAETCVALNLPSMQVFSEQVARLRQASAEDWEAAFRKAAKARTKAFDSHPCLKERLKPTGLSKKQCLQIARRLNRGGEPAATLVENWEAVERQLSDRIVSIVHEYYQAKMEAAQILLGGPVQRIPARGLRSPVRRVSEPTTHR